MTRVVYKDGWLARYQYCGEIRYRTTHSLEVPMNNIAGVEVTEAISNIR